MVNGCDHLAWLQFSDTREFAITDTKRISRLLPDLDDPSVQRPSIVFFVGSKAKDIALRELFPWNNIRRGRREGIASLRAETLSLHSSYPIFFAESNPLREHVFQPDTSHCHEVASSTLEWADSGESKEIFDVIHARLLFLFVNVLCIFADDFPDFLDVVNLLQKWASFGKNSSTLSLPQLRVIIVKRGRAADPSPTFDLLETEDVRFNLQRPEIVQFYSSVTVLYLADEQISPLARYRRLKELLQRQLDEAVHFRQACGTLFSALHLAYFFSRAVKHFASTTTRPFDYMLSTRPNESFDWGYSQHLVSFLQLGTACKAPCDAIVSHIASTILLDAYPPGCHRFDPVAIFDRLYRTACFRALETFSRRKAFAQCQTLAIKDHLIVLFSGMLSSDRNAAVLHRNQMQASNILWRQTYSNRTCLSCLRRSPEYTFSCGHAICDTCTQIFGIPTLRNEFEYQFDNCLICYNGVLQVTIKPPTAGVRILSIDGGGVRGVVPLEFLALLQDLVGPDCPIQSLFDLAFGTSSGGLIVLSLFVRQWGVAQCIQTFEALSRQFFQARRRSRFGCCRYIRRLLKCWLTDGYYNVDALEAAMKASFGPHERLFGTSQSPYGTKIAVTATSISDASPFLFTNYNGQAARAKDCGYKHLRPPEVRHEPFLWEAGRATSAAPMLFKPANINRAGTFQDGGLKHNNPINLALWEIPYIWPSIQRPDIVVSLGTGTGSDSQSPRAPNFRHVIQDGFIPRLWRSFMSSLDGQSTWRDLWNRLDERSRDNYFRFNVSLSGDGPAMDDIQRIAELRACVHLQPDTRKSQLNTAFALLISAFFFELSTAPIFQAGRYFCEGTIRCRLTGRTICQTLQRIHQSKLTFMTNDRILGQLEPDDDLCSGCSRYLKKVHFTIRHPTEQTTMFVQSTILGRRNLSSFPQSMQWFVDQQRLAEPFGTLVDYNRSEPCGECHLPRTFDGLIKRRPFCQTAGRKRRRLR